MAKTVQAKKSGAKPPKTKKEAAARPAAPSALPAIGRKAPAFSLPADDGGTVSLCALAGKKVVLYFYPKDDTPGCTAEAVAFTARRKDFDAAGAIVIGISRDTVASHCKFKSKHALSITLASDETGATLEKYGVWVEKRLYGRTYMGIERTTFLIDGTGVIRAVWPKVKVAGHAGEVLAAVQAL